ncbi:hypothetical protein SAZ11_08300 [Streptomyces sp. FXJ1.4098]|nr:hypothetical protein [Streptomyces sp. FXJ1.4098]
MPERTEHALLYIKYVDDALAEQGVTAVEGAISGISLRILARALPDGRTSVAVSLYRRVHRMRASGKAFHYWTFEKLTSMARTKKDLVVLREIDRRTGISTTRHVFSETVVESWIHGLSGTLQRWMHSNPQARRLEGPEPRKSTMPWTRRSPRSANTSASCRTGTTASRCSRTAGKNVRPPPTCPISMPTTMRRSRRTSSACAPTVGRWPARWSVWTSSP